MLQHVVIGSYRHIGLNTVYTASTHHQRRPIVTQILCVTLRYIDLLMHA